MIERAESVLHELGFRISASAITTRSRASSSDADEMARALEPRPGRGHRRELRAIGYAHVTVDLRGYRLGSLNDALPFRLTI